MILCWVLHTTKMGVQFSHLFCEAKVAAGNQDLSKQMKNQPSEVFQIN